MKTTSSPVLLPWWGLEQLLHTALHTSLAHTGPEIYECQLSFVAAHAYFLLFWGGTRMGGGEEAGESDEDLEEGTGLEWET